ncbi:TonB-dependent receptor plug domain-containing protein [bacterium]|nr:TonB-dependent receptor plug domain-containing protein [bacterium]
MHMRKVLAVLLVMLLPVLAFGKGAVIGKVVDAETGLPLVTAQVTLVGTTMGSITDLAGVYAIDNVPEGDYILKAQFLGYKIATKDIDVESGEMTEVNFKLVSSVIAGEEMTFFATRAKERETPVAFANVEKAEMKQRLGSRDIPMVLNTTPSVYATPQGGGAGDSRINVRGFNQRNVAVMINGVPVNDMENGWVYWSNWDGLGDVTSSIQVQRGLSAANLAVPSIGGTMNIITDAADMEPGIMYRSEIGTGKFQKNTIVASTGLINEKFALTVSGVRKTGEGVVENTWTDAYGYFLGASYIANEDHKFDFYVFGAPQRHGHRLYSQSLEVWDTEFAEEQGIDADPADERGIRFNPNWGYNNYSSAGEVKEYWNGSIHAPYRSDRLQERENYYHKPQANFNWYWDISEQLRLSNVFYYSKGMGGGTGGYGSWWEFDNFGRIDFDATIQRNQAATPDDNGEIASETVIRNSVNDHVWYGWIGKAEYEMNENMKVSGGVDYRYFVGEHYREVRNLLGGDYYMYTGNPNDGPDDQKKRLGDKIAYNFTNDVMWIGGFLQGEYTMDKLSAVIAVGANSVGYRHENFFRTPADGQEIDWQRILGYFVKGGANYNLSDEFNLYTNLGYNSKPPIFDGVISDYSFTYNEDPLNEEIIGFELGSGYRGFERRVQVNANFYYTMWNDRTWTYSYTNPNTNEDYLYTLEGVDAVHTGLEFDFKVQPRREFSLDGMVSIGNWEWASDVDASFRPENNPSDFQEIRLSLDGLKVGDQPQTTVSLTPTVYPIDNAYISATWNFFAEHYADYDPLDREYNWNTGVRPDREQSWKVPNANVFDLHVGYAVPNHLGVRFDITGHIFNVFNELYVIEADDGDDHTADDARVFLGLPRYWNVGLQVTF